MGRRQRLSIALGLARRSESSLGARRMRERGRSSLRLKARQNGRDGGSGARSRLADEMPQGLARHSDPFQLHLGVVSGEEETKRGDLTASTLTTTSTRSHDLCCVEKERKTAMDNTMIPRELQAEQDLAFMDEAVIMVSLLRHPHTSLASTAIGRLTAYTQSGRGSAPCPRNSGRLRTRARRQDCRSRSQPHERRPQRYTPRRVRCTPTSAARKVWQSVSGTRAAVHAAGRRRPRRSRVRLVGRAQSLADTAQGRRSLRHGRAVLDVRFGDAPGRDRKGHLRLRE